MRGIRFALAALLLTAGCATATSSGTGSGTAPARLQVNNHSSVDFDVYLLRSDQRNRLGLAPAGQTTSFALSRPLLAGSASIRFEADPTRGSPGRAVLSDPGVVNPGGVIILEIPPQ
jgi:hypothetical protein